MAFKRTKYRAPDPNKLKERGSRSSNRYDSIFIQGVTPFKPAQGTNILRIVKDPDADYYGEPIWVHSYVGTKNSTYLCPKKMGKSKECPICDMADEAARAGDKDERYQLEAKERVIAYVLDRQDEKAGLKVWDMSWTMDRDVADACVIKKTGKAIDITHPDAGYDLSFTRTGTTKNNTRYGSPQIDRESTPLSENQRQADAWIDEVQDHPLLSLLKYRDAEYLADILLGKIEEKDEDEGEGAGERQDPRPARGRGTRDEPPDREEEGYESEDNYEAEEERQAPPPRRGSRDAGDRQAPRSVRGGSRWASDNGAEDANEEDGGRVTRRGRGREDQVDDREPPPREASRVRRQQPDDEPDDPDSAPPRRDSGRYSVDNGQPRRAERGRPAQQERDEESEAEAEEAGRWARGRGARRGVEDSGDPVDAQDEDNDRGERGGRATRRQRLDEPDEREAPPPRRNAPAPTRERTDRERAPVRGGRR